MWRLGLAAAVARLAAPCFKHTLTLQQHPTHPSRIHTVGTISLLLLAASARADVETRPLATAITSLTSNSGVDVSLKALAPGQTNSTITVEAPTGQLVLVKTEVVGNALTVTLDPAAPATTNADKMKVTILLPATNLAEVNSQGAGDLDIDVRIKKRRSD